MTFTDLAFVPSDPLPPFTGRLRLAVAAYLTASTAAPASTPNPACAATCPDAPSEVWTRWPPGGRTWNCTSGGCRRSAGSSPPPSPAVSRSRPGYRTCALDGVLPHSPAGHVRRPSVPAESPTLGFTHLQFEALPTAARESANPADFALVAMLGLPGLRIFEAMPLRAARPATELMFTMSATWRGPPAAACSRCGKTACAQYSRPSTFSCTICCLLVELRVVH
jgi:hypothetical protein